MQSNIIGPRSILVLADDSANWVVAGVRQLDRLALAANESGIAAGDRITLHIFWKDDPSTKQRWFPQDARLTNCIAIEAGNVAENEYEAIITTRVFIGRDAFTGVLAGLRQTTSPRRLTTEELELFSVQFATRVRAMQTSKWWYLDSDNNDATQHFLQTSGQTQDGFVSRTINRQISRTITRQLLPLHIRPTTLTLAGFIFPILGFICLAEGSHIAQIIGAVLFLIHSIVSGCDGELARAKYRESVSGGRLDKLMNELASGMLVFGTGLGLFRGDDGQSVILAEGVLAGILVVANGFLGSPRLTLIAPVVSSVPRRKTVLGSDVRLFLRSVIGAFEHFTNRDVAYPIFLAAVLFGRAGWFLHAVCLFMIVRLILALRRSSTK